MPGPFTHIYAARRVADFLAPDDGRPGSTNFVRPSDGPLDPEQQMLAANHAFEYGTYMKRWPKYTSLGAIGPDLFFFSQDYHQTGIPSDEIMLALRTLYLVDDAKREDWEPFLAILEKINQTWASILRFLIKLDKIWQKFKQVWDDTIGKVVNAVGEFIDDLSGGMLSALGDAISQFLNELIAIFAQELLSSKDIFSWFSLVMQEGVDEQAFTWSDTLHYRKTSLMATNLLRQARLLDSADDHDKYEQFMAYALGYICHLGTDTTAHTFVNEQCGGPFRTHWQRHHLIENHIDAWNYSQTKPGGALPADTFCGADQDYESLAQAALYFAVQLTPDEPNGDLRRHPLPPEGKTSEEKRNRKEALDTDGEMPDWLARGIVKAMIDTYYTPDDPHQYPANYRGSEFQRNEVDPIWQPPDAPLGFEVPVGFPLPWEVQVSYRFMLTFFKRTYMDGFDLPKPPRPGIVPGPTFDPSDLAPDFSGVNGSDSPAEQAAETILSILNWLKKLLKHAAEAAWQEAKHIASTATYPAREWIYENITLPSWQGVRVVREVLVHLAFLTPQDVRLSPGGELMHPSEIDQQLIQLGHSVDAAFRQALADATDPLGNLDKDTSLIPEGLRNPQARSYPYLPVMEQDAQTGEFSFVEFHRPWAYPDLMNDGTTANQLEFPITAAGPYPVNLMPHQILGVDGPADNELRWQYEQASSPHVTDCLSLRYLERQAAGTVNLPHLLNPLGDPIPFSAYLIGRIGSDAERHVSRVAQPTGDFNLDADRGYAYLCWDWERNAKVQASGYRGRSFEAPCAWPEAAKPDGSIPGRRWQAGRELKLHYKTAPNRGCDPGPEPDDCSDVFSTQQLHGEVVHAVGGDSATGTFTSNDDQLGTGIRAQAANRLLTQPLDISNADDQVFKRNPDQTPTAQQEEIK